MLKANRSIHYKMYKQGRFWVFAGITALTWQVNAVTAAADTTAPNTTTPVSTSAPKVAATTNSTVTLKGSTATPTKASTTSAASQKTDASATSTTTAQSATKPAGTTEQSAAESATDQQSSQATTPTDQSAKGSTDQQSTQSASTTETPAKTTGEKVTTDKTQPVTTKQQPAANSVASSMTTTQPAAVTDEPANQTANQVVAAVTATKAPATVADLTAPTQVMATTASVQRQAEMPEVTAIKNYAGYDAAVDTQKGIFGTSEWWIDGDPDNLVLHIGGGTLGETGFNSSQATALALPWLNYNDELKKVIIEDTIIPPVDSSGLFGNLKQVTTITGLDHVQTDQVTNMHFLFFYDQSITSLDLNTWQVQKVTDMSAMFYYMSALTSLKVNQWQTDSVTNLDGTFENIAATSLDVANWQTGKVTDMSGLFQYDSNLKQLDVSSWDVSNVDSFQWTFEGARALATLDVSRWNTSRATNMFQMFSNVGVEKLDLSRWDMRQVTDNDGMFLQYDGVTNNNNTLLELSVGPTFRFVGAGMKENAGIGPSSTNYPFDGRWMNKATGRIYTNTELIALYQNSTGGPAATYVPNIYYNDRSEMTGQNFNIYQNEPWDVGLGVSTLLDYRGIAISPFDLSQLTYSGVVDTQKTGNYPIAITYTSGLGKKTTVQVVVTVVPRQNSQAHLTSVDTTMIIGPKFDQTSFQNQLFAVIKGQNDAGQPLTWGVDQIGLALYESDGSMATVPVFDQPHVYQLLIEYGTSDQVILAKQIKISLIETQAAIHLVAQPKVIIGPTAQLKLADYFESATDAYGQPLSSKAIKFDTSKVDLTKAGSYQITADYEDVAGNQIHSETMVQVVPNTAKLELKPVTVVVSPTASFDPEQVIATGTTSFGTTMTKENGLKIESHVNPQKVGQYLVTVSYTDASGNSVTKETTVTVKNELAIQTQPVTLMQGQSFDPTEGIASAVDSNGQTIDPTKLTYDTQAVDVKKPGTYQVKVSYTDSYGNVTTGAFDVTVQASGLSIQTQPVTLVQGQPLDPTKGIASAVDSNGQTIDPTKLTYDTQSVDIKKPGTYQVKVSYTDSYGNVTTGTFDVTVQTSELIIQTQPVLNLKLGDQLDPTQAVISATTNGQAIAKTDLSYDVSQIDLTRPGTYQLVISYQDQYHNVKTQLVPVNISAVGLTLVAPVTVTQGTAFALTSLVKNATDAMGHPLAATQLTYIGTVNTAVPGQYPIKVTYQDQFGNTVTQTVMVTVKAAPVTPTEPTTPDPDPTPTIPVDPNPTPATPKPTKPAPKPTKPATSAESEQAATVRPGAVPGKNTAELVGVSEATANQADQAQAGATVMQQTSKTASRAVIATKLTNNLTKPQAAKITKAKTLPQTAEQSNQAATLMGVILLGLSSGLAWLGRRVKRHE